MNANDQELVNALRGPMIMITIGVLLLLDNLTPLRIGQTWPILLILVGVLALAGGSRRRSLPGPVNTPFPNTYAAGFPPEGFASSEPHDQTVRPGQEYRR